MDFFTAAWYSYLAYDVGRAYQYSPSPKWSAEQVEANRKTMRASYFAMLMSMGCAASMVPLAVLPMPFWGGPWWGYAAVAASIFLIASLWFVRRELKHIKAEKSRIISRYG
jgi:hypothetical protein